VVLLDWIKDDIEMVGRCILCGEKCSTSAPAVVSPWIREMGIRKLRSHFFHCQSCEFGFFSHRYNSKEMTLIYSGYRGQKYLKVRSRWEPWYSDLYNSNHDSFKWIESRKSAIEKFLIAYFGKSDLSVADIGGDSGQFIPDFASSKYVVDPSKKDPVAGVVRVTELEDLPKVDLIIYAHVLEHVADPVAEIKALFSKSKRIYIEVPFGIPRITKSRKSYAELFKTLFKSLSPKLWKDATQPAAGRSNLGESILTQSEHLNFFTEHSMRMLSNRAGGALMEVHKTQIETPDYKKAEVLQCLLVKF
jgi:hypothetical protein